MELIKFNFFDNLGSFVDYVFGCDGVVGLVFKIWFLMWLLVDLFFYVVVGGDGF